MEFSSIDTLWVLLGAAMVFLMQAGFAMVETGFTRAKNAGNIIMKNLMDFSLGTIVFWLIGFGLMYGAGNFFIGELDLFIQGDYDSNVSTYVTVIFQTVFCATAATIVSGAMAERTKFSSYCLYSIVLSGLVYPISGHWVWGGGWLSELGFNDFAGSAVVHMVGGVAALVGAKILGPRIGKFDANGKPKAIPGHSLTLGALGVFILWFCWFGFNGTSTLGMEGSEELAGLVFMNTNIAPAVAAAAVMIITWFRYGKPDVSMTLNGALAGLVGITAGCNMVDPFGAAAIGIVCAFIVVFGVEFIEKVLKIDDPVGAVAVHGFCGAAGTVMVGLFATEYNATVLSGADYYGLFYGGGAYLLGVQALGVVAIAAWVAAVMTAVFLIIKHTVGLRVSKKVELAGLDYSEHGLVSAYADFIPSVTGISELTGGVAEGTPVAKSIEVVNRSTKSVDSTDSDKITKAVIVANTAKFDELKLALNEVGVTGMTVTQVLGHGIQKGKTELYRGAAVEPTLLPKIKIEIVVCKVTIQTLVDAVTKVLYTGHAGDGKIFIYDVENVIRISTGDQGYNALQDEA